MTSLRMLKIAGLDYSLTKTGVAILTRCVRGHFVMNTITIASTGRLADTLPMRRRRLTGLRDEVVHALGTCDLVIAEGVVPAKGALLDRYGALWFILDALIRREIPVAVVSPKSAKKAITDNGNADKALMAMYVAKLWPELRAANEHECDATGLAHLGAVALGWNVPTLERHKQVKWTEWPEFGPDVALVELPGDRVEVEA